MSKLISIAIAAMSAVLITGTAANATQYVVNGDFTQLTNGLGQIDNLTSATGWTSYGYNFVLHSADQQVNSVYGVGDLGLWDAANGGANGWNGLAAGGGNFAALDGDYITGPLQQTISGLTVGQTYKLSFNYAFSQQHGFGGATIQSLDYSLGAATGNTGDYNVADHGFTGWQSVTRTLTAQSTTETLSFLAHGNLPVPPFALVSNVSLTAVPEPATWGMMILGLGAVGLMARRRRARSTSAVAASAAA